MKRYAFCEPGQPETESAEEDVLWWTWIKRFYSQKQHYREKGTEQKEKRQTGRQTRADLALLALRIVCLSVLCQCHNDADSNVSNISSTVYRMDINFVNPCKNRIYDSQQETRKSFFPIINTYTVLYAQRKMRWNSEPDTLRLQLSPATQSYVCLFNTEMQYCSKAWGR